MICAVHYEIQCEATFIWKNPLSSTIQTADLKKQKRSGNRYSPNSVLLYSYKGRYIKNCGSKQNATFGGNKVTTMTMR